MTAAQTRWRRPFIGLAAATTLTALAFAAAVTYLLTADLGRHRERIERALSNALGLELRISELEIDLGLVGPSRITAGGVTVGRPEHPAEPPLAAVERLEATFDLLPLLARRVVIHHARLSQGHVRIAVDDSGRSNWSSRIETTRDGTPDVRAEARSIPEIVVQRAILENVETTLELPTHAQPLRLDAARLELSTAPNDDVLLQLAGALSGRPLELSGRLGPLNQLLLAGEIHGELDLALSESKVTVQGSIGDLAALGRPDLRLAMSGPDLSDLAVWLDSENRPPTVGPVDVRLELSPEPTGALRFAVDGRIAEVSVHGDGRVDSPRSPTRGEVHIDARGRELASVAAAVGVSGLPPDPFEITGRVVWDGFPVTLDAVSARVGENAVSVDGVLGAPPVFAGTELELDGQGPDAAAIAALLGLQLPASPFRVTGRVLRVEGGIEIERLECELGADRLEVRGRAGEPPSFEGTKLSVHAHGSSLARFAPTVGLELPDEPWLIRARLGSEATTVVIEDGRVELGGSVAQLSGRIVTARGWAGSNVTFDLDAHDLAALGWIAPGVELPQGELHVVGDAELRQDAVAIRELRGTIAGVTVAADGLVGLLSDFDGTALTATVSGTDAGLPLSLAGLAGGRGMTFSLDGRLAIDDGVASVTNAAVAVGPIEARVRGRVPIAGPPSSGDLEIEAAGPSLADLESLGAPPGLPAVPFRVAGKLRADAAGFDLERVDATVAGDHHIGLSGRLSATPKLTPLDVRVLLDGPSLGAVRDLLAGLAEVPPLPDEAYRVEAMVAADAAGFDLKAVVLELGTASAEVRGRLGRWPELDGTNLEVDAEGPNVSLITAIIGFDLAPADFAVRGRVRREAGATHFDDVSLRYGFYEAAVDGDLGAPPRFEESNLTVRIAGPDLEPARALVRHRTLPKVPFSVEARLAGSQDRFEVHELEARLGQSDVRGSASLAFGERDRLEVRLVSHLVDVAEIRADRGDDGGTPEWHEAAETRRDTLFSDEQIELPVLDRLDGEVAWRIGQLRLMTTSVTDLELEARLDHRRLVIGPVAAAAEHGGVFQAQLVVEPIADGFSIDGSLGLKEGRMDLTAGTGGPDRFNQLDGMITLRSHGATSRQLATNATGRAILSIAGGEIAASIVDLVGADLVVAILEKLNPFHGEERGVVPLECAVLVVDVADGELLLEPMAVKTGNLTVLGHGTVDLETEALSFEWVTKPRKGLGISASTITNPYVKLGGTLTSPSIAVKPAEAVVSTSVAVATGGLSLLGKGLFDRVTAESKVCEKALEEAAHRLAGGEPHQRRRLFR